MRLFHVTHKDVEASIRKNGLLPKHDERRKGRVWLSRFISLEWAMKHVAKRHGWALWNLVVLEVDWKRAGVPIKYHGRRGIYYTEHEIQGIHIL